MGQITGTTREKISYHSRDALVSLYLRSMRARIAVTHANYAPREFEVFSLKGMRTILLGEMLRKNLYERSKKVLLSTKLRGPNDLWDTAGVLTAFFPN